MQVVYDGDKSDFVFWDKECRQILGVTADTLRKTMQEVGEDDPLIYPKHLTIYLALSWRCVLSISHIIISHLCKVFRLILL